MRELVEATLLNTTTDVLDDTTLRELEESLAVRLTILLETSGSCLTGQNPMVFVQIVNADPNAKVGCGNAN